MSDAAQTKYRRDYRTPDFWVDTLDLDFQLDEAGTRVRAKSGVRRNSDASRSAPLVLDGEELELISISIDGTPLEVSAYRVTKDQLELLDVPDAFTLETEVLIHPETNTTLSGLYQSSGNFCTQCEAEGFRRITYSLDRPDVMSRYTVRVEGDRARYPVLLSNGNRIAEGEVEAGRHWVQWEDPFPKPSYLFAMVAGDLRCHDGTFTTMSGREVRLEIWVEPQNIDRCEHALASLQKAMKWDEEVFGLEYDLDIYMIVAVNDFNMGAMENKGLNVFNSKYVLARPDTATDDDYEGIEGVIAHEYFHNWTGNRVTCRDWFQLTLKEGLTVFRDQQFSADMGSPAVKRIEDVKRLRAFQFPEDAGPTSHPIRPESYIEMNNFYTATVYEKGAEVIRMIHRLLGADGFRRGMDLYFERHDGQAVTCDDFRLAMADGGGADLAQFERWYEQPGTPVLEAEEEHDAASKRYTLRLRQAPPDAHAQEDFLAMHLPVEVGLLDAKGEELTRKVLELRHDEEAFTFEGIDAPPVASILRGFSAPVQVRWTKPRDRSELAFLMAHDRDEFNRWEAGQTLAQDLLLELAGAHSAGETLSLDPIFVEAFRRVLLDPDLDGSLKALALMLPGEKVLGQAMEVVDVDGLHAARRFAIEELSTALRDDWQATYQANLPIGPYQNDGTSIARRRLKNLSLRYLSARGEKEHVAALAEQLASADNMTDAQAALVMLGDLDVPERSAGLGRFYGKWRSDPLVVDKWFSVQATTALPDAVEQVLALRSHPDFSIKNPNRVRSLVGAFGSGNTVHFHRIDGAGYRFLADAVIELDALNPQVASRMVSIFNPWRRYDEARQGLMQAELERIAASSKSRDVREIVGKSLAKSG